MEELKGLLIPGNPLMKSTDARQQTLATLQALQSQLQSLVSQAGDTTGV
jgi:hypothetical protein